MAKRGHRKSERLIYWRNGRAYGDFRAYADEGGTREALSEAGKSWGTTDPEIADVLYDARLAELKDRRRGRIGVPSQQSTTLAKLTQRHLLMKEKAGISNSHLGDLETRLRAALGHFGWDRDPRTIVPNDVREWAEQLGAGGRRKPGTVRHYLNALSGLYGRAQEGLFVAPGYNPVSALQEKPSGHRKTEAKFFELADAALLLEAARILEERDRKSATPGLHAIIATFLLTGGRKSEVLGLDVEDVSFDRNLIRFRPNAHRGLKTSTSHRTVPLWPQLKEILQEWIFAGDEPRSSGLLFPSPSCGMIVNLRKSLDQMGRLCRLDPGEVRTRAFRHTYCSARLQTVQRILKPGREPGTDDSWEYVEVARFTVQKEMGHGGAQLVNRVYGHAQRTPHRSDAVEYRIENHAHQLGQRLKELRAPIP